MDAILHYIVAMQCVIYCVICTGTQVPQEKKLHDYLLRRTDYSKSVKPSGNGSGQLTVKLGMRLTQLLDVDEKNQIMTTNVWLRHEWVDDRLRWDPDEFGGIEMTHIPSIMLWRPDIVIYNNADGDFEVRLLTKASVYHDGRIVWEPPVIYKTFCAIDVEFFPFDIQECFMKFGVWTYNGHMIDLQHVCSEKGVMINEESEMVINRGIDLKGYYPNVEWDIINVTARRKEKFYPCCPQPYPDITFNVTLRRRTLFYTLNLIMPCISISLLTVLVFYLPSDSGEKITLSISILLALTVFFLLLSDINPPTSLTMPLIGKYLLFTMVVVTMSIFLTVYTLNINYRSPATHTMSPWVKTVFLEILPKVLCMRRPGGAKQPKVAVRTCNGIEMRNMRPEAYGSSSQEWTSAHTYENLQQRHPAEELDTQTVHHPAVQEAIDGVKYIAEHLKRDDEDTVEVRDWKYVAMVMDRLFLFIFTTACLCGTLSIFLYAPSLYDPRQPLKSEDNPMNCTY